MFLNFFNKYKYLFLVIIVSLIVNFRWLSFDIFNYSDYFFKFSNDLKDSIGFNAWISSGLGSINLLIWRLLGPENITYSFFGFWGFNSNIPDKFLLIWPWITLSAVSSYFLVKKITKSDIASLIGSFVFCFNTYFLSINRSGHLLISLSSVFGVLSILFFIELFNDKKVKSLIFSILFLFLTGVSDFRLVYLVAWILIFYFIYHFSVIERKIKYKYFFNNFLLLSLFFIILFLINIFWIAPSFISSSLVDNNVLARSLFGNSFFDISKSITLFYPFWTGGKIDWFIVQKIPFYFWLVPIFAFLGLILNRKNKQVVFFGIVSLIGIFLSKQVGEPFGNVYNWLFENFLGFNAFREAGKFYFLIIIGYSVLIGSFASYVWNNFNKSKKQVLVKYSVLVLISFLFLWNTKPVITGEIGSMYISRQVPEDYLILKNYISSQNNFFRTFWVPNYSKWSVYSEKNPLIRNISFVNNEQKAYFLQIQNYDNLPINEKIVKSFQIENSNEIFDNSVVKYVIIPINDFENEADPFIDYGRKQNEDIRSWYIAELDKISWLKKIDIGTKELVIYENEKYKPYISSLTNLYSLEDFTNLKEKYNFVKNNFNNEFNFVLNEKKRNGNNLICLYSLFENIDLNRINKKNLSIFDNVNIFKNNTNNIYSNQKIKNIFYKLESGEIIIYTKTVGDLYVKDGKVNVLNGQEDVLFRHNFDKNKKYYIKIIEKIDIADDAKTKSLSEVDRIANIEKLVPLSIINDDELLGEANKYTALEVYSVDNNMINNSSFEDGIWQEKVGDCYNYDENPILSMSLNSNFKTDGAQALQLSATKHNACVNQKFKINSDEYIFGFDYQSSNSKNAGFYLKFDDINETKLKNNLVIEDSEWHSYFQQVTVPEGSSFANLYVYAYESDKKSNNTIRYDNFVFSKLVLEKRIEINDLKDQYKKIELNLNEGENIFEYKDEKYSYDNVFLNGSFEDGIWQEKVGDCYNHDANPIIKMSLNESFKTNGKQSLQLEAVRHTACISKSIDIDSSDNYILKFDYQGDNSKFAGYYIGFNDSKKTKFSEKLSINGTNWKTLEKKIEA